MKPKGMTVAGVMSGTSADGIDVALVHIARGRAKPSVAVVAHEAFPYSAVLRRAVLAAMNASNTSTAELARLNWRLGIEYARAIQATARAHRVTVELVGCHGQTLYHQGKRERYAGENLACTWQAGEPAVIAHELRIPVASNFRPADMVVGGQGAPLVPLLDYVLFSDSKRGRVLQNIGGIANLTAIPPGATLNSVVAFDTGPGNMLIDALAAKLFGKKFDRNGSLAARGHVIEAVLQAEIRHSYYRRQPPKSAGREQFGREYAERFIADCRKHSARGEDAIATATALTAETIATSYKQFVHTRMENRPVDYIVSGGGARNASLMAGLTERLEPLGCKIAASDDFGLAVEAKEAAAFALLAWYTWHRLPGNVPAATGAARSVILGQLTFA